MSARDEPVVVYAGTLVEVDILKSLLEVNGIRAFLQNESMGVLASWYVSPGGAQPIRVIVAREDADEARRVVAEFVSRQNESAGEEETSFVDGDESHPDSP